MRCTMRAAAIATRSVGKCWRKKNAAWAEIFRAAKRTTGNLVFWISTGFERTPVASVSVATSSSGNTGSYQYATDSYQ